MRCAYIWIDRKSNAVEARGRDICCVRYLHLRSDQIKHGFHSYLLEPERALITRVLNYFLSSLSHSTYNLSFMLSQMTPRKRQLLKLSMRNMSGILGWNSVRSWNFLSLTHASLEFHLFPRLLLKLESLNLCI
jgi:hypothetical protein